MHRLRWRLCKYLKIPVDDKFFSSTNTAQMYWYQIQLCLDEKENYELLRDIAEHTAMFYNPEGVSKIRAARENTYKDENFDKTVKDLFGRDFNTEDKKVLVNDNIDQFVNKSDPYLNMELDEIKFIPIRGK